MSKVKCPTCGTHCAVNNGAEGTGSFIPADEEIERLTAERDELAARLERVLEVIRMISQHYDSPALRECLEETPTQSLASIKAQGMQMAADICEGLYMGTYEWCEGHHYTDNCAEEIEAAKKELKGE